MASFSRQSALPWLPSGKALKETRRSCSGFPEHQHGLALWGIRSGECRGDRAACYAALARAHPTGRPGRIQGLLSGQSCHRSPHQPAATAGRPFGARRSSGCLDQAHRAAGHLQAPGATRPARPPSTTTSTRPRWAAPGLFRVTASLGQAPRCPIALAHAGPRSCRRIAASRIGLPITAKAAPGPPGADGPITRLWSPPRFPSADCVCSPAGRRVTWPAAAPLHGGARRPPTPAATARPRGVSCGAPRGSPTASSSRKASGSQAGEHGHGQQGGSGQSRLRRPATAAAWAAASAWRRPQRFHRDSAPLPGGPALHSPGHVAGCRGIPIRNTRSPRRRLKTSAGPQRETTPGHLHQRSRAGDPPAPGPGALWVIERTIDSISAILRPTLGSQGFPPTAAQIKDPSPSCTNQPPGTFLAERSHLRPFARRSHGAGR